MKRFLISTVLLFIIIGCVKEQKKKNVNIPNKSKFISHRNLHEQTFGGLNYSSEQQWDSLNGISSKLRSLKKNKVDSAYRTFGWHIYSNGSAYKNYDFSMLWGISYFSYGIVPETGDYKSIHEWKTTALVDSAKVNKCKVFLTISNFGSKNNATFLESAKAQEKLVSNLINLLELRDADGINIDFEGVSKKNKKEFTRFIVMISKKLKKVNPKFQISLCLYAIDWNNIFDIKSINTSIDFYTLMGYDYYGSFSKNAGPVIPLKTTTKFGRGLESSVEYYLNKGIQAKDLIVGLPYYGAEWYTRKKSIPSKAEKFKSHPPYKTIRKIYIDSLKTPIQFDLESASSYLTIKESEGVYKEIWFEDVKSLSMKYDWIKKNKIGGVGIWALGYDDGYSELWNLLTDKFSEEKDTISSRK